MNLMRAVVAIIKAWLQERSSECRFVSNSARFKMTDCIGSYIKTVNEHRNKQVSVNYADVSHSCQQSTEYSHSTNGN